MSMTIVIEDNPDLFKFYKRMKLPVFLENKPLKPLKKKRVTNKGSK